MGKKQIRYIWSIVIIVLVFVGLHLFYPPLLTQDSSQVRLILIRIEPDRKTQEVFKISDKRTINHIYQLVEQTHIKGVNRHPFHTDSVQCDSRFSIEILYSDGKSDLIQSWETPTKIYKKLNSRGTSGDYGHILGDNPNLWRYVDWFKGQHRAISAGGLK